MDPHEDRFFLREAEAPDVPEILSMIRELAEYERLAQAVTADAARLEATLFGPRRYAEVLLGCTAGGKTVGFALFFHNYSTFLARPGIYLEDLFVRPPFRGRGLGRMLLARLARIAKERGCGRLEWSVLDWNEPAITFYRNLGARPLGEWTTWRVTGEGLDRLAEGGG